MEMMGLKQRVWVKWGSWMKSWSHVGGAVMFCSVLGINSNGENLCETEDWNH